jgi:hypothetical protein
MGRLKLNYQDLFIMSLDELNVIQEGHEIDKRDDWERSRLMASLMLMPNLKKGAKLEPEKIWPLPWDKERPEKELDVQSLKEKTAKAKELYDKFVINGGSGINRKDRGKDRRLNQ